MSGVQVSIEIFYTTALLTLAGIVLACYFVLFYLTMIALDSCEICKSIKARRTQKAQGHSVSRTKRALTQPREIPSPL